MTYCILQLSSLAFTILGPFFTLGPSQVNWSPWLGWYIHICMPTKETPNAFYEISGWLLEDYIYLGNDTHSNHHHDRCPRCVEPMVHGLYMGGKLGDPLLI